MHSDIHPQAWQGHIYATLLISPYLALQLPSQNVGAFKLLACQSMRPLRPLHPQQHGFRCDRSTETAVSFLADCIECHIYSKSHCLVAFFDIRSAFDSITPQHIQRSLTRVGTNPGIIGWYHKYLLHRNMTYHHSHTCTKRTTGMGFPQGAFARRPFGRWRSRPSVSSITTILLVSHLLTTAPCSAEATTRLCWCHASNAR